MRKVVAGKLVLGATIFILLAAAIGGLFFMKALILQRELAPGSQTIFLEVLAPGGNFIYSDSVEVENGTALAALLEGAAVAGFPVEVAEFGGSRYVRAIANVSEGNGSGWVYEVWRDGAWDAPPSAADAFPLRDGERLRWRFTSAGS